MESKTIETVLFTFGGAEKSSFEMTSEEFRDAGKSILRRAKEKAFSKGLPIYYGRNGEVIAEYADGHIEIAG